MKYRYKLMDVGEPESKSIGVIRINDNWHPEYFVFKKNAWVDDYDYLGKFLCGDREEWDLTEEDARRIIEENGGTFTS